MYRVIAYFIDLQDGEHAYQVGDAFPREGHTVSEARIKELAGSNNKRKMPLIEAISEPVVPEKKVAAPKKEAKSDRSGSSGATKSKSRKTK